jgi:RNA polymerase sigma-70 factor (ECF subfamily)
VTRTDAGGQLDLRPAGARAISPSERIRVPSTTEARREPQPFDFERVFVREASFVWNSLRRLGVPSADLDDALHDVFVAVYRQRETYDSARSLRAWLFGFAHRVAARQRRTIQRRRESHTLDVEPRSTAPLQDEIVREREKQRVFLELLDALPLDRRAVLILHDVDGEAMADVASAIGIPVNTAYSRLRLAREDLLAAGRRLQAHRGEL